jgi:hypothetical protein
MGGPYVIMNNYQTLDGNNDLPDYDETIDLEMTFENVGNEEAYSVTAELTTADTYVTITDGSVDVGNIGPQSTITISDAFEFETADDVPDQHVVIFDLNIIEDETWSSQFNITVNAPVFEVGNLSISDPSGNNDGILDPGETVTLTIPTHNIGHAISPSVESYLSCGNDGITIGNGSYTIGQIDFDSYGDAMFELTASDDIQVGTAVNLEFDVVAGSYGLQENLSITVGLCLEDFESGDFSSFPWEFDGDMGWIIDGESWEGDHASKSGSIGDNQVTAIEITMFVLDDSNISFYKKVSSEATYDFLRFYIDGDELASWSGEETWSQESFAVTTGEHTFTWEYDKDGSVSSGTDCAWIDYIVFPPNAMGATGFISGYVTADPEPDYTAVEISAGEYMTNPDETGFYTLEVAYGTYDVTAVMQGYETVTEEDVDVAPYETTELDITLPFIAPPVNLQAELMDGTAYLTWEAPETRTRDRILQYYKVYRNHDGGDFLMIYATTATDYDEELDTMGSYGYYITAMYSNNSESDPTETVYIEFTSENDDILPIVTELKGNYPNPFNPTTTISYSLKENADVLLEVYNMKGQKVVTLVDGNQDAGNYDTVWTGKDDKGNSTASGMYFYKMRAGKYTSIKKMLLMK